MSANQLSTFLSPAPSPSVNSQSVNRSIKQSIGLSNALLNFSPLHSTNSSIASTPTSMSTSLFSPTNGQSLNQSMNQSISQSISSPMNDDEVDERHNEDAVIFVTPASPSINQSTNQSTNPPRPSPLKTDFHNNQSITSSSQSPQSINQSSLFISTNPLTPQTPHIVNPHNISYPPHHAPGSIVWASRKVPSQSISQSINPPLTQSSPTVNPLINQSQHKHILWPAEVLDLEVNQSVNRVKIRYIGVVAPIAIIDGESCIPFMAHLDRLKHQSSAVDFNQSINHATQILNDREKRSNEVKDESLTQSINQSLNQRDRLSLYDISSGTIVRLRSADQIHYKLCPYANTDAEVIDVPAHPNTWFSLRLVDGKEVKIRKSAFDVIGSISINQPINQSINSGLSLGPIPSINSNDQSITAVSTPMSMIGAPFTDKANALSSLYSRMNTPMGMSMGNLMPPMTPLSQMPLSPATMLSSAPKLRPLPPDTLVRIKMTPDTAHYPQIINKDGRIVSASIETNVYTVRLTETNQPVILHRSAIVSIDANQPDIEQSTNSINQSKFHSPSKFPWNHIRQDDDSSDDEDANKSDDKLVDVSIESGTNDVKVKISLSPRDRDVLNDSNQSINHSLNSPSPDLSNQSPINNLTPYSMPVMSNMGLPMLPSMMDPSLMIGGNPVAAMMQMQMLMQMMAVNPALAAQFGMMQNLPITPPLPTIIHTGQSVTITHGNRTGEVGVIAGVNSENVLVRLGSEEIVKKISEVEIIPGSGNPAAFLASVNGQPTTVTPQTQIKSEDAPSDSAAKTSVNQSTNQSLNQWQANGSPGQSDQSSNPAHDEIAPTITSAHSQQQQQQSTNQSLTQSLNQPTNPVTTPFNPDVQLTPEQLMQMAMLQQVQAMQSGMPVNPIAAQMVAAMLANQQRNKQFPANNKPNQPLNQSTSSSSNAQAAGAKRSSMKNLIGRYVQVIAGRYKGDVGIVVKGSNGYFSVRLSQMYADLADSENVVMKRSSDLRPIDPATAHFEILKRTQQIQAEKAMRERAEQEAKQRESDKRVKKERREVSSESSSSDDSSDSSSDDSDDSDSSDSDGNSRKRGRKRHSRFSLSNESDSDGRSSKRKTLQATKSNDAAGIAGLIVASKPIPPQLKPESLNGMFVYIKKGKFKDEVAVVRDSGHGFYECDLLHQGSCKKRSAAIELIVEGDDAIKQVLATRAATTGKQPSAGGKLALNMGTVKNAASLLIGLSTEPNTPVSAASSSGSSDDSDDSDSDSSSKKKAKKSKSKKSKAKAKAKEKKEKERALKKKAAAKAKGKRKRDEEKGDKKKIPRSSDDSATSSDDYEVKPVKKARVGRPPGRKAKSTGDSKSTIDASPSEFMLPMVPSVIPHTIPAALAT